MGVYSPPKGGVPRALSPYSLLPCYTRPRLRPCGALRRKVACLFSKTLKPGRAAFYLPKPTEASRFCLPATPPWGLREGFFFEKFLKKTGRRNFPHCRWFPPLAQEQVRGNLRRLLCRKQTGLFSKTLNPSPGSPSLTPHPPPRVNPQEDACRRRFFFYEGCMPPLRGGSPRVVPGALNWSRGTCRP